MNKKELTAVFEIILIIIAFIVLSWLIQTNLDFFEKYIGSSVYGMFVYFIITIIAIVIAPVSMLPLITIATNLWGIIPTVILNVTGWTIGSLIAFLLARKYGVPIVKRLISLDKIYAIEKKIPQENLFWSVVFFRMVIPADILSYALGLFSKMKTSHYTLATLIGVTPFAFVFAYLGIFPWYYQSFAFLVAA
ncbi:MAG: TVP38/TMEM64 family protein, partial [Candidatus Nanoarchaeia archaeon]